jgi:DNA uptake protein ComE-like DNA-binding protein
MSAQNIKPEAVDPAAAASILATVNGAASAEALAAKIELPNEPDIGLRLATHILERRAELGGSFTTLDQLLTVNLLGPVRFSRVVRAILGQIEGLIRAEDVAEADAAKILAFLNGAETAQAFADGIELPNEPDIGLRLGAHLIDRRAELGGSFTSLDQLLTVKLIGPVRFTRIVRAILGITGVGRDEFADLAAQVQALQEALAAAPPRVVVRQVEPQRYLGQPMTLVATVTGADGLPVGGVPVTLSATWGRLRGSDGFSVQEGGSVSFRASGDGSVRATLLPPTSEGLEQAQQDAVESALGILDPSAATPRDAGDALDALVRLYQFEANDDFRDGVDIYFRDFREHLLDTVNYRDELESWPTFDSAVVAYVHQLGDDGKTDTGVVASGALVAHVRDWLGAWLQTHIDLASDETLLGGELEIATGFSDPNDMLSRIHQSVGEYVSLQQGVVGQAVGQRVAEGKLGGFLESGIDVLPEEKQQALFPAVDTSSATIGKLGVQALGAFEQTRVDLRAHVDTQLATGIGPALEQSEAFSGLQAAVAGKVDQHSFDSALATKLDLTTLNDKLKDAADFSAFKTSLVSTFAVLIPPGGFIVGPPGG